MNRRIFATIISITPLFLFAGQQSTKNICELNLIDTMTDKLIFNKKDRYIKCKLNNHMYEKEFEEAINNLLKNPFEEDNIELCINIIVNDNNPNLYRSSKERIQNSIIANQKAIEVLFDSFMWIKTNSLKQKALLLLESELSLTLIQRSYSDPLYRNYLIFKNIGKSVDDIEPRLSMSDIKDRPYRLLYSLENGIKIDDIDINKILKNCLNSRDLERLSSEYTNKDGIELFVLSKIYKEKSNEFKNMYFAISDHTKIWEYLDYRYNLKIKNFILASENISDIYSLEKKEYLKRQVSEISFLGSKEAYSNGDLFKSWTLTALALNTILSMENRVDSDSDLFQDEKNHFRIVSNDLIALYEKSGNNGNAEFIKKQSKILMKKVFIVSKKIKMIS